MNKALELFKESWAIHVLVLSVMACYGLLRITFLPALGGDEAEQVLFTQSLAWGYDVTNPPLYSWVLYGLFALFGKSAELLIGVKLVVVGALYISLYHAARLSLGAGRRLDWALVGLSPFLLFVISWNAIFSYSHSLLNGVFVVLTYIAVVKLVQNGTWRWYGLLGLFAGLGVLTKYSYGMFVAAIVVAGMTVPQVRSALINIRFGASLLIALAVVAPHGLWLLEASAQIQEATAYKLQMDKELSYVTGLGKGLWNLVRASFAFLSPLWLVVLVVFPTIIRRPAAPEGLHLTFAHPLLGRTFLVVIGFMVLMVLGGVTQFRPNYLFLMILLPLWVFLRLPAEAQPGKRRRVYAGIIVTAIVLSVGGLAVKSISDPLNCKKCQHLMDYKTIADELRTRGFTGGAIMAHWYPNPLPGNLILEFDTSRIVSTKFPTLVAQRNADTTGQCLLVTISATQGGANMVNLAARAKEAFGAHIPKNHPMQSFTVPYLRMADHPVQIDYAILDPNTFPELGDCR